MQTPRHADQKLVANIMAQTVIDDLEAVEIQVSYREQIIGMAFVPFDGMVEPIGK